LKIFDTKDHGRTRLASVAFLNETVIPCRLEDGAFPLLFYDCVRLKCGIKFEDTGLVPAAQL
jgi:hypothetical protein